MAKSNPWDLPPFPDGGDLLRDTTFAAVGRVVCEWEAVEFNLSRVHSVFCGDEDGPGIELYGAGRIFRDRLGIFCKAADCYFTTHPNQDLEGRFSRLVRAAEGFADRRNEVAHGIVLVASNIDYFRAMMNLGNDEPRYALIAPVHQIRKHANGLPSYAYNASKLDALYGLLADLNKRIERFRQSARAVKR